MFHGKYNLLLSVGEAAQLMNKRTSFIRNRNPEVSPSRAT